MMSDNEDKCKMLFSACESGDKLALTKLIKSDKLNPSSYDMITDRGKTLLHIACRYGHIDIVRMLIEIYGCSPHVVDNTGSIPFHDACYYDQVLVVDYLLHAVAKPNEFLQVVDLNGNTAFHKANQSGSSQVIKYILYIIFCEKLPPKLSLDMDYDFQSCHTSNLKYFLVQNKVGDSPPAVACRHGHLTIIKLYMHCNDHFPGKMLENIPYLLYTASQCGQYEIVCYLQNNFFYKNSLSLPVSEAVKSRYLHSISRVVTTHYVPFSVDDEYCDHYYNHYSCPVPITMRLSQHYKRWSILKHQFKVSTISEVLVYMPLLRGDHQSVIDFHALKEGQLCSSDEFNICHAACIASDIDLLNLYFSKSISKQGNSPLHTACEWGSKTAVEHLITKCDCDLNACNSFGETPLHIACRHERVQIVELLLEHCPNTVNNRSGTNETPLHLACLHSDVTLANLILDKQPSNIDIPDVYGDTPLLNACRVGNVSVIKLLVEKGCDPLYVNENSMEMSIHIACRMQRLDILEVLVKNCNTKVDTRNCFGETPLCIAMNSSCMDVVHFMVSKQLCDASLSLKAKHQSRNKIKETGDNALHLACKLKDLRLVQLLLDYCPVNIKNNDGDTPFHIAAIDGSFSVMKCLISSSNYPLDHVLNTNGNSALHLACESGSLRVVQLLLDCCSVTLKNLKGDTPIHIACYKRYSHLVRCLLEKCSGNLDYHTNKSSDTFLHVASKVMDIDTVKLLLGYCSATCQNSNGDTPIHIACRTNMQSLVACLLERTESNLPIVNKDGQTYLHCACSGNPELDVIKTIIESGYKTLGNYPDNNGDTPLHYICHSSSCIHEEIIEYLVVNAFCDPYKFNKEGLSPLYYTLRLDKLNFLKHAVSNKLCDPNRPLKNGSSLLHCLLELATNQYHMQYLRQHRYLSEHDQDVRFTSTFGRPNDNSSIVNMFHFLTQFDKNIIDFNATDEEGNTVLHLACQSNQYKIIEILLSTESDIVRQSISHRNHNKKTPIQLTSDYRIIRLLISYGANPEDVYRRFAQILDRSKEEQPLEPTVKVIVLGNSTAGKTTLVKALKSCRDVMEVKGSTAGIETSDHNSKEFGRVTFHDFAGQPEFESSHSAFLERCSSSIQPPIFILVVNASQCEYIERRIHNWLSFIQNHCTCTETPPHVIVIGSHSDKLFDSERSRIRNTYTKAIESFKSSDFECFKPVLLDCRRGQSKGMKRLQRRLKDSCLSLKKFIELDCRCHILFANLAKWFPKEAVVTVKELQVRIKHETQSRHPLYRVPGTIYYSYPGEQHSAYQHYSYPAYSSEVLLPISTDPLLSLLKSLHTGGHILLLEGVEDSWIVMNQDALFKTVNGILFAPKDFKQHVKLDNNTGVVPLSKLQSLFPQLDFNMVKQFIVHYEFCQQIEDAETLQLIHGSSDLPIESEESSARIYYFFPGYVKSEKPATLWDTPEDLPYTYSCGWMLQCQPKQCFETRFLHVLLLRLTFTFVASSSESSVLNRKCDIWKNGIHWGTRHGVEVLVEVIEEKTIALVLVRCFKGQELEAVKLRTAVLKKVWEAKKEFCPRINTNEYLVHPSELASFCSQTFCTNRISMTEITQTIIEGSPFVICPSNHKPLPLDTLLYYEPYSRMDEDHIKMFFTKENANSSISPDTLYSLSNFLHPVYQHLVKVLKIPSTELGYHIEKWRDQPVQLLHHLFESWTSRREQATFGTLRSEFDQYSIFFGRDPLVSLSYISLCMTLCITDIIANLASLSKLFFIGAT